MSNSTISLKALSVKDKREEYRNSGNYLFTINKEGHRIKPLFDLFYKLSEVRKSTCSVQAGFFLQEYKEPINP